MRVPHQRADGAVRHAQRADRRGRAVAVPFIWRRFGFGYAAVVVLGLLLPLSSGQFEGLGRYCSVLFPLPILLGGLQGETRHFGMIAGFVLFYALGLVLFGNVHPLF